MYVICLVLSSMIFFFTNFLVSTQLYGLFVLHLHLSLLAGLMPFVFSDKDSCLNKIDASWDISRLRPFVFLNLGA